MSQAFDPEPIWDKEIAVAEKWIHSVDDNVYAKLPEGTHVLSIRPHGSSYWTRTAEIKTEQANGSRVSFFVKVTEGDAGKGMVSGEFVSMTKLREAVPALVPRPIAWGTYAQNPDVHFFLCEFVTMTEQIPDPHKLGKMLSELHSNNVSPNGKYGFEIPTYQGTIPQKVDWQDTWEGFFSGLMERIMGIERESQGPDEELGELSEKMMTKVIPRLLRPLETGGRQIQPRLLHGDIWDGNCSTDADTDLPVIFDATSLYAHNEMEMGPWRPIRHQMGKPFYKAYTKHFPMSEPVEDFDDRNNLYCMRFNICCSALYPGNLRFRKIVMEDMRYLVGKHGGGYEAWAIEQEYYQKQQQQQRSEGRVLIAT